MSTEGMAAELDRHACLLLDALSAVELRGGSFDWMPRTGGGVFTLFTPPQGSLGSPISITAVADEVHVVAGAGGRDVFNYVSAEDIDDVVAVIVSIMDGGARDYVTKDTDYGYEMALGIESKVDGHMFTRTPGNATLIRAVPPW